MASDTNPPITFRDFRPGISDNPGTNYPPEQATRTNTFRCLSNRSGALVPGMRRTSSIAGTHFEASNPTPGFYLIVGFYAGGPVVPLVASPSPSYTHELFIGTEYLFGGNRKFKLERRRMYEATPSNDLIKNISRADATVTGRGWGMTFGTSRSNKGAPTTPGIPIVVFAWGSSANVADSFTSVFPDDATPTLNAPYDVQTGQSALICTHQGRIVLHRQSAYGHGVDTGWNPAEDMQWTAVFNPGSLGSLTNFVPENPDGYSVMQPMSANELFALKASFAVMFQGDLNDPIVINLPMVPGTPIGQSGVVSPAGLLYGNPLSGVWSWMGGDSAKLLSPQMRPDFWTLTDGLHLAQQYQWATMGDLVVLSNNWIYDIQTSSWWRLEDDSLFHTRYITTDWYKQFLYGSITQYTHAADTIAYEWTRSLGSSTYSWQSHPIWQSIDRILAVREVDLVAQGQGTVTLTCTGFSGATTSEVITLDNTGYPERHRRNFYIQGQYLQLRIQVDSGSASVDGPTVFSVALHPDPRARLSSTL